MTSWPGGKGVCSLAMVDSKPKSKLYQVSLKVTEKSKRDSE